MVTGIRYPDIPEMKIENESEKGRQNESNDEQSPHGMEQL